MSPPGRIISVEPARRNDGHTRSSAATVDRSSTTYSPLLCRAAYVALIMMGLALAGCETRDGSIGTAPMATSPDAGATIENTPSADLARPTVLGGPLANLSATELARFNAGLEEF